MDYKTERELRAELAVALMLVDQYKIALTRKVQWQPIETAPRDGQRIVVSGDCWATEARWNPYMGWVDGWGDSLTAEPTYWTDLPSASGAKTDS